MATLVECDLCLTNMWSSPSEVKDGRVMYGRTSEGRPADREPRSLRSTGKLRRGGQRRPSILALLWPAMRLRRAAARARCIACVKALSSGCRQQAAVVLLRLVLETQEPINPPRHEPSFSLPKFDLAPFFDLAETRPRAATSQLSVSLSEHAKQRCLVDTRVSSCSQVRAGHYYVYTLHRKMSRPTIFISKFVGTISLGLLTVRAPSPSSPSKPLKVYSPQRVLTFSSGLVSNALTPDPPAAPLPPYSYSRPRILR